MIPKTLSYEFRKEGDIMNDHHPIQTESQKTKNQPDKMKKKPWFNQGWIWLIVAAIGIGVVYFGLSDITERMAVVNQSIQENTQAIEAQRDTLYEIKMGIQQLIVTIKDSVNNIIQSI